MVDGLGNPISFLLSGGEAHDSKMAVPLLKSTTITGSNVLGDRAYGTNEIRSYITQHNANYVIPP